MTGLPNPFEDVPPLDEDGVQEIAVRIVDIVVRGLGGLNGDAGIASGEVIRALHGIPLSQMGDVCDRMGPLLLKAIGRHETDRCLRPLRRIIRDWAKVDADVRASGPLVDELLAIEQSARGRHPSGYWAVELDHEDEWAEVRRAMEILTHLEGVAEKSGVPLPDSYAELGATLHKVYKEYSEVKAELDREERLAARAAARAEPTVAPTRVCSSCGKRPARVDELCKRCAHDAGILPHGKIGAG